MISLDDLPNNESGENDSDSICSYHTAMSESDITYNETCCIPGFYLHTTSDGTVWYLPLPQYSDALKNMWKQKKTQIFQIKLYCFANFFIGMHILWQTWLFSINNWSDI